MPRATTTRIETIIEGHPDEKSISQALDTYRSGLLDFAVPKDSEICPLFENINYPDLKQILAARLKIANGLAQEIILEINTRSKIIASPTYQQLIKRDKSLWQKGQSRETNFAVLACVDKGIPYEAVIGVDGVFGRTLAGDISVSFSPSKNIFFANEQIIIKRLIHAARQGNDLFIEPLIEHTGCGRRGQLLANETGVTALPSMGYAFNHIRTLASEFTATSQARLKALAALQHIWDAYPRQGRAVKAPDGGLLAGVILKIAERQALHGLNTRTTIVCPIEIYDKRTGDLVTGIDSLTSLTSQTVLEQGGYTDQALDDLSKSGEVFSLKKYWSQITAVLQRTNIREGQINYEHLQLNWLGVQTQLVDLTAALWNNLNHQDVKRVTKHYLQSSLSQIKTKIPGKLLPVVENRLTHHLFHIISYAYLLGTIKNGHPPGLHHIEDHLAIGDHEIGSKTHLALGQGDLDDPSASEMFTGYSVLLHSKPGANHTPIPVMIKLDTDRAADKPLSTEETRVAMNDFAEFLQLWPYFLVGELIPYLVVRSKATGGVSRLALSVILTFNDIIRLFEQKNSPLPQFVPAVNSQSEVVYIPANRILEIATEAKDDLQIFRNLAKQIADKYTNVYIQTAFSAALKIPPM